MKHSSYTAILSIAAWLKNVDTTSMNDSVELGAGSLRAAFRGNLPSSFSRLSVVADTGSREDGPFIGQ